jgi:hypothetical protein
MNLGPPVRLARKELVLGLKEGLNPDVLLDVITSGVASGDLLVSHFLFISWQRHDC